MTELEKELTIKVKLLEDDCKAYNFTQHTLQERIKELEATNKNISNECHTLVDTLEKKQNECNQLLKDKSDLQDLNNNLINQHSKLFAEKEQLSQDNFFQKSRISDFEAQIEKMKEVILELLSFEGNLDPYMYECDGAQNGELLKPFTNARELLKDCICKKCKGEGIVRVGYNGWDENPCPICKGIGYVIRSN